jgi:hypothetical protein
MGDFEFSTCWRSEYGGQKAAGENERQLNSAGDFYGFQPFDCGVFHSEDSADECGVGEEQ